MEVPNYDTLNDCDTSNDACTVDANTTTPSASGALPSSDTFLTNSPMPDASWWNELPFIENAISDLSETIQKVHTDSSDLASTNQDVVSGKQIYNIEDRKYYTLNDCDTSNDACTVDANTTTPSASGALPFSDTFHTNSPMPDASWWNELPFIENAISDLSETIQKVHTDSSDLASTNQDVVSGKQIYNIEDRKYYTLNDCDTSNDACTVDANTTTPSASGALPSFDMFLTNSPMPGASWWNELPFIENAISDLPETIQVYTDSSNLATTNQAVVSGKQDEADEADRSSHMESFLDHDQHDYNLRHSTPTKDESQPAYLRRSETTPLNFMNGVTQLTALQSSQSDIGSANNGCMVPSAEKFYRRQSNKPPYSYIALVIVAIETSVDKELTLAEIRKKLQGMFPFFRGENTGWEKSVRHALSHSKCFYQMKKTDTNVSVWKVHHTFVKRNTFKRNLKEPGYETYKPTLQEELGLPAYGYKVQSESRGKDDLCLPPKPRYSSESGSVVGSNEDFLNGRNDIVPTPLSTVSDIDYVQEVKPSRKRKHTKKSYPTDTQSYAKQPSTVAKGSVHDKQYLQSSESGRAYDSMFSSYYPAGFTNGQQVSNDFYCYRNPQPKLLHHWNYWDNEISLQHWWFQQSMYHRMSTNWFPLMYQTNTANWFPGVSGMEEAPLNLTKGKGHSQ